MAYGFHQLNIFLKYVEASTIWVLLAPLFSQVCKKIRYRESKTRHQARAITSLGSTLFLKIIRGDAKPIMESLPQHGR